ADPQQAAGQDHHHGHARSARRRSRHPPAVRRQGAPRGAGRAERRVKYLGLVWAALRRRPTRTLLTFLSVATAFFLFGGLQAINVGIDSAMTFLNTARLRVSSRVTMGQPMPLAHVARIAALPSVSAVTGLTVVIGTYQRANNVQLVLAIDPDAMFKLYPE